MTGPDEILGVGSECSSWAILLAVMSQQFVDDSLQRIIIIKSRIELRVVLPARQNSIYGFCL